MSKRIYLLRTNYTVDIKEVDIAFVQLIFQYLVWKRTSTRKAVNRLNDKQLHVIFRVFAVVDGLLHRLLFFGRRFHKHKLLNDLYSATRGVLLNLLQLIIW